MRIIGIEIEKGSLAVIHNLEPGWYPFGDYKEPNMNEPFQEQEWEKKTAEIYQVFNNMPEVTVSSIVGNNGSGKSSLIDIMFRMINNLAFVLLDRDKDQSHYNASEEAARPGRELNYAYGLWASLYFETFGNIGRITCSGDEMEYAYRDEKNGLVVFSNDQLEANVSGTEKILRQFFYTISCNYSQYAFRKDDYQPLTNFPEDKGVDGEWLSGIYHKNDGYVAPLVMTPYRKNGLIDFDNENKLSQQRLVVLSILFYIQGRQFLDAYNPVHITYTYDLKYLDGRIGELIKRTDDFDDKDLKTLVDVFQKQWKSHLKKEYEQKKAEYLNSPFIKGEKYQDKVSDMLAKDFDVTTYYLAYKSLKICLVYSNYQKQISIKKLAKKAKQGGEHLKLYAGSTTFTEKVKAIVGKQFKDESHVTLKIHQSIAYFRKKLFDSKDHLIPIDKYVAGLEGETYDDIVKGLPPSYYSVDVTMMPGKPVKKNPTKEYVAPEELARNDQYRKGEVRFSQMSSGQRQLMNSLSYIIYHIKNIQSIKNSKETVAYRHINIVFDEAEMYAHPNYQRDFVHKLLEAIHWCHIDRRKIKSIHILLATHSPFVLSDVLSQRSLYLEEGHVFEVKGQSFGGNYYELLQNSFFFKESAIGRVSTRRIQEWVDAVGKQGTAGTDSDMTPFVGDPIVKRYLEEMQKRNIYWSHVQDE